MFLQLKDKSTEYFKLQFLVNINSPIILSFLNNHNQNPTVTGKKSIA